jgi:thioredoxin-like negative regulator of GroEL
LQFQKGPRRGSISLRNGIGTNLDAAHHALKADPEDSAAAYHLIVCLRKEGDTRELPQLMKKLAEISTAERERTATINRYKLVEEAASSASSPHSD